MLKETIVRPTPSRPFSSALRRITLAVAAVLAVSCGDPAAPDEPAVGSIDGVVRDGAGAGVAGAAITISRSGSSERTATSAADGSFTFTSLETGSWSLDMTPPTGFDPAPGQTLPLTVEVVAEPTAEVTLEVVARPGAIEGSVLWRGEGVSGVEVTATGAAGAVMATTDSEGDYDLSDLAPGSYSVEVAPPTGFEVSDDAPSPRDVSVVSDESATADFVLRPTLSSERFLITPTAFDFGQVIVGELAPAQTVTVFNLGPGPAVMSGSGGAAGVFGGVQSCQGITLEEGESCEMTYAFGPTGSGEATASTSGTWNGQPFSLDFRGEGVERSRFAITPIGFDFGYVRIGETTDQQIVDIENLGPGAVVMSGAGGAAGVFGGVQNCQGKTIAVGESCQNFYRFTPTVAGDIDGSTGGNYNGQPFAFAFQGVAIEPERFSITPTAFDFGEVEVGETSPQQTVTITNLGPGPIVMSGAGGAAGQFGGVQNCQGVTLEEGESCQQFYAFTPSATGEVTGSTNGTYNGQGYAFEFRGVGIDPGSEAERFSITPTAFDFGEVVLGTTAAQQTVTITNLGPGPVVMSGAGGAAGEFGGVQNCQGNTLEEGESCEQFYAFTPTTAGEVLGSTSGSYNGQSYAFDFRGVGVERDRFLITPTAFDFGDVAVGTTSPEQTVTITNLGPGPVVMSGAGGAAGQFGGVQNCQGTTLEEGESCEQRYAFTPSAAGDVTGATGGSYNGQSYAFEFKGNGIERPRFLISPTAFDFGEVPVGSSSPDQIVTVLNLGPGPVVMSGAGGAAGVFGGVQNCQGNTLEEGESCQLFYSFTPTGEGEVTDATSGTYNGQAYGIDFRGVGVGPGPGS